LRAAFWERLSTDDFVLSPALVTGIQRSNLIVEYETTENVKYNEAKTSTSDTVSIQLKPGIVDLNAPSGSMKRDEK
jgi:hypothetical protein